MVSESWKKTLKYPVIAVILGIFICTGIIFCLFDQNARQSEQHYFHYSIDISYNHTIENVTILLPVPLLNGTTALAEPYLDRTVYGIPDDWELSIEMAGGMPMLAIRAERMVPEYHGFPIAIEPGESPLPTTLVPGTEYSPDTPVLRPVHLGMMLPVNRTINTRNPVGSEPVFNPEGEFTRPESGTGLFPGGEEYVHTVPVYVRYAPGSAAQVHFSTSIQGVNSIWSGGWVFNSYEDTAAWDSVQSQEWTNASASLFTGVGVYY